MTGGLACRSHARRVNGSLAARTARMLSASTKRSLSSLRSTGTSIPHSDELKARYQRHGGALVILIRTTSPPFGPIDKYTIPHLRASCNENRVESVDPCVVGKKLKTNGYTHWFLYSTNFSSFIAVRVSSISLSMKRRL